MSKQRHCIGRQSIEIVLPGKDDLPSLRQRIGEIYKTRLLPEMERIFSDFFGPEGVTRFDLIELDLGVLPLSDLDTALCDRLGSSLRAELQRRTGQAAVISEEAQSYLPGVQEGGALLPDALKIIDGQALRRELLLHFLDRGTFPWWAEETSLRTVESILLQLIDRTPDDSSSVLQESLSRDTRRMRLIHQVPDEVLGKIAVILGAPEMEVRTWIAELPLLIGLADDLFMPGHLVRSAFWESVLTALLTTGPVSLTREGFIASFLCNLARFTGHDGTELVRRLQHALRDLSLRDSRLPGLPSGEGVTRKTEEQAVTRPDDSISFLPFVRGDAENFPVAQLGESTGQDAASRFFVGNAGLIILWPYLGSFFGMCRLLREGAFTDELSAMQAVNLLQYLVNREQEPGEQHLTLNKVLCGWPLNRPLCRFLPFPEGAGEESERLLQSVIDHWSILKNTSPQCLQESFLQRRGILCDENATWVLHVERRSYDMLLDYLPWGITMVQLSWMTKPLIVQW